MSYESLFFFLTLDVAPSTLPAREKRNAQRNSNYYDCMMAVELQTNSSHGSTRF